MVNYLNTSTLVVARSLVHRGVLQFVVTNCSADNSGSAKDLPDTKSMLEQYSIR